MLVMPFLIQVVDMAGAALVLVFSWAAFRRCRRLVAQDQENALWLFLYWLSLALLAFGISRALSHIGGHLLIMGGQGALWSQIRPYSGGLNAIFSIIIASITLFFQNIQRLYRRMAADHYHMEATSHKILALNREMEALVMERTMSEMALGIADGIRNPLHVIGGFSNRLVRKTNPEDPARNWAMAISEAARRLEEMVVRFEKLAQDKKSFFSQEDLNKVVRDIMDMLQGEFHRKHIHLITGYHPYPVYAQLNKHLLKVAIAHLVRNALEATSPQGEIRITTSLGQDQATLVIQDTGKGMAPEVVSKVFEPYYTTKVGGTGLGMVFVRQIVDEHRGIINLHSEVGVGTTVTIHLPVRFSEAVLEE
ncbi:MAG: HAMP domain-containing histidine kinase [Deltaproteobacteria bacterium]|nr:HAMP domain-containing histidine kinase [Deltaproteobacteria bacterium]